MKVWELGTHEKSRQLGFEDISDLKKQSHPLLAGFKGTSLSSVWSLPKLKTLKKGRYSDFSNLRSGVVVISQEVYSKLHSFIDNQVEFLAVDCEETNYQLVNVLNVLDCVDKVKSKAETAGNGAVVTYLSMVFNQEKIPGSTLIFKIPELVSRRVYVTDAFLKLVSFP